MLHAVWVEIVAPSAGWHWRIVDLSTIWHRKHRSIVAAILTMTVSFFLAAVFVVVTISIVVAIFPVLLLVVF